MNRTIFLCFPFALLFITSCASVTEGLVRGLTDDEIAEDTRKCWIEGREFQGIKDIWESESQGTVSAKAPSKPIKILKIHGIGSHKPGYSARLRENIVNRLNFTIMDENTRRLSLVHPEYADDLGVLTVDRYIQPETQREIIYYELTWDPIIQSEKDTLDFDNSSIVSTKRTTLNHTMKTFVNDTIPDALMYNSPFRFPIQLSVSQAICWMLDVSWEQLPVTGDHQCLADNDLFNSASEQEFAIISHSLGSRIALDALHSIMERLLNHPDFTAELKRDIQDVKVQLYMLSNQLPLLQLGQAKPSVTGQIQQYCYADSPFYEERFFKQLQMVAVSDPNDLFSYIVPPEFVAQRVDSRLCPSVTNVVINVAEVNDLFGIEEIANPLNAHTEYENDARVIALIAEGFGKAHGAREARDTCSFMQTIP